MFLSIQVQSIDPNLNLLDLSCQISKVHEVQLGIEDINPNINLEFKENSPFQEGVLSETFQRPDKSIFQEPEEFGGTV